jgi:RimJ/RimL family protein N-acetyltransferase
MHIVLETPRLILRRFSEADALLLLQLNSNPEVVKYVHEPTLETEEQALKIIVDIILPQYKNNLGRWAIHLKDTNEFMGWCGLKYLPERNEIDLGYRLFQNCWGHGYATEAAKHTLDYGFKELKIPLITGKAHKDNSRSIHVLEKIGMLYINEELEDGNPIKIYTLANPSLPVLSS